MPCFSIYWFFYINLRQMEFPLWMSKIKKIVDVKTWSQHSNKITLIHLPNNVMMFNLWYYLDFEDLFKFRYEDILLMLNRDDEPEVTKFCIPVQLHFDYRYYQCAELNSFAFWRTNKYFYLYFKWHSIHKIVLTDTLNKYFLTF